jgi:purine-nucleoside phosphorylase
MSIHIHASPSDVAATVLLPGDSMRAKFIAETYFENPVCYNKVRAMYGYTGIYKGKRVSVQGTGIGIPSVGIYVHELIAGFGVKTLIRIGSCGAIQHNMGLRDIILAVSASTDSGFNRNRFNGMEFAPTASFNLLRKAWDYAIAHGIKVTAGNVLTSDTFYYEDQQEDPLKIWRDYGVLAVEMETTALYTLAARYKVNALSILTVSDSSELKERSSIEERERSFKQMSEIALEIAD